MPTHREIAEATGYERSYITKMLTGRLPMKPRVQRAIDDLRRQELAAHYTALADDALAAGETEVAAGALRMAARRVAR